MLNWSDITSTFRKVAMFAVVCLYIISFVMYRYIYNIFSVALPAHSRPWSLIHFSHHSSQTVGLLGGVISSSPAST
jgi:hypothetical protein